MYDNCLVVYYKYFWHIDRNKVIFRVLFTTWFKQKFEPITSLPKQRCAIFLWQIKFLWQVYPLWHIFLWQVYLYDKCFYDKCTLYDKCFYDKCTLYDKCTFMTSIPFMTSVPFMTTVFMTTGFMINITEPTRCFKDQALYQI